MTCLFTVQLEEHTTLNFFFSLFTIHRGKIFFPHMLRMWCWQQVQGCYTESCRSPAVPLSVHAESQLDSLKKTRHSSGASRHEPTVRSIRNLVEVDDVKLQKMSKLVSEWWQQRYSYIIGWHMLQVTLQIDDRQRWDISLQHVCGEQTAHESESSLPIWSTYSLESVLIYVHFFRSAWNFHSRFYSVHL